MDVHGLHGRATGALAQVVDARHQHALVVIAKDKEIGAIGVVAPLHVKEAAFGRGVQRRHLHEALARITGRQRGMDGCPVHVPLAGSANLRQIQRHRHRQPLVIRRHHGQKHGRLRQAGIAHHLGQVLVGQPQRVGTRGQQLAGLLHRHLGLGSRAAFGD